MGETIQKKLKSKVVHKHELEADWLKSTYLPEQGEWVVYDVEVDANGAVLELPEGRTAPYTYQRMKMGDGIHNVNELPFLNEAPKETWARMNYYCLLGLADEHYRAGMQFTDHSEKYGDVVFDVVNVTPTEVIIQTHDVINEPVFIGHFEEYADGWGTDYIVEAEISAGTPVEVYYREWYQDECTYESCEGLYVAHSDIPSGEYTWDELIEYLDDPLEWPDEYYDISAYVAYNWYVEDINIPPDEIDLVTRAALVRDEMSEDFQKNVGTGFVPEAINVGGKEYDEEWLNEDPENWLYVYTGRVWQYYYNSAYIRKYEDLRIKSKPWAVYDVECPYPYDSSEIPKWSPQGCDTYYIDYWATAIGVNGVVTQIWEPPTDPKPEDGYCWVAPAFRIGSGGETIYPEKDGNILTYNKFGEVADSGVSIDEMKSDILANKRNLQEIATITYTKNLFNKNDKRNTKIDSIYYESHPIFLDNDWSQPYCFSPPTNGGSIEVYCYNIKGEKTSTKAITKGYQGKYSTYFYSDDDEYFTVRYLYSQKDSFMVARNSLPASYTPYAKVALNADATINNNSLSSIVAATSQVPSIKQTAESAAKKTIDKISTIDTRHNNSAEQLTADENGIAWNDSFALQYGEEEHSGTILHRVPFVAGDNVSFDVEEDVVRISTAIPNEVYIGDGDMPEDAKIQIVVDESEWVDTANLDWAGIKQLCKINCVDSVLTVGDLIEDTYKGQPMTFRVVNLKPNEVVLQPTDLTEENVQIYDEYFGVRGTLSQDIPAGTRFLVWAHPTPDIELWNSYEIYTTTREHKAGEIFFFAEYSLGGSYRHENQYGLYIGNATDTIDAFEYINECEYYDRNEYEGGIVDGVNPADFGERYLDYDQNGYYNMCYSFSIDPSVFSPPENFSPEFAAVYSMSRTARPYELDLVGMEYSIEFDEREQYALQYYYRAELSEEDYPDNVPTHPVFEDIYSYWIDDSDDKYCGAAGNVVSGCIPQWDDLCAPWNGICNLYWIKGE